MISLMVYTCRSRREDSSAVLNVSVRLPGVEIEPKQCQICRSRREDCGAVLNVSVGLQGVEIEPKQWQSTKLKVFVWWTCIPILDN